MFDFKAIDFKAIYFNTIDLKEIAWGLSLGLAIVLVILNVFLCLRQASWNGLNMG
jgi:hypothetical protein